MNDFSERLFQDSVKLLREYAKEAVAAHRLKQQQLTVYSVEEFVMLEGNEHKTCICQFPSLPEAVDFVLMDIGPEAPDWMHVALRLWMHRDGLFLRIVEKTV